MLSTQSCQVLANLWAKSPTPSESTGETLLEHTAAVLSRLERLFDILPGLAARVGDDRLWHRAALSCVLHDFGKAATGFQRVLKERGARWNHRHEVLSLAFIEYALSDDSNDDLPWVAAGVVSHHKDFARIRSLYPPAENPGNDPFDPVVALVSELPDAIVAALAEFIEVEIPRWLSKTGLPIFGISPAIPSDPATDFQRHAATRIYSALDHYHSLFDSLERESSTSVSNLSALALRGIILLADHTASAHVTPPRLPGHDAVEILDRLNLSPEKLHGHQEIAAKAQGNSVLVAPTGSGKTEAALLWSANQRGGSPAGRLFYVLPYQASINAMYDRLTKVFPQLVTLQHSRAAQALYRRLLETDRYDPSAAAKTARFQRSLAHLHFHPVRVLTPYQLLRSAFRLRGYESIIADAANGLFVFDEIHAYEPTRLGMILGMSQYLARRLGGRFMVMSATFPSVLRNLLNETLAAPHQIFASAALYQSFARHRLEFVAGQIDDASILDRVSGLAASGQSVLVVCNTVSRSKRVHRLLAPLLARHGIRPELLHSRFNSRDRHQKEHILATRMGTKERQRASAPVVLVATQVVEVSLDIDFDTIFTEPAPLEALIQRLGRVNRARKRPPCPVYVLTSPASGQGVYPDSFVTAALDVLLPCNGTVLDESKLGELLDRVYSGEIERNWIAEVQQGRDEFIASCLSDLRAFQSKPELAEQFDSLFDGTEVLPQSLVNEYDQLMEQEPLRASELFVPISFHQLVRFRREGKIDKHSDEQVLIARVSYTDEGLMT